ncbi:unnamed protein product [Gordionus sp. m RMFG-2023]|uniref:small ribosomal subunit protein uS10m-like isoform X2 n=1 Tax=Gordionus sp. m RMFG-2023 TaxID=3053472 RepID=UPI0030E348D9
MLKLNRLLNIQFIDNLNFCCSLFHSNKHTSLPFNLTKIQYRYISDQNTNISPKNLHQVNSVEKNLDDLYKQVVIQLHGHDPEVIKSYMQYILMTTYELNIDVIEVKDLPKEMHRRTLLKSAFVHKKHRVQYEWRTHYKNITMRHLTGSTLSTFLEYIERNLPEGIAMRITKTQLLTLPEHLNNEIVKDEKPDGEIKKLLYKNKILKDDFEFPPPKSIEFEHYF